MWPMRKFHSDSVRIEFYDKSQMIHKPKFTHNLIPKKKKKIIRKLSKNDFIKKNAFPFIILRLSLWIIC